MAVGPLTLEPFASGFNAPLVATHAGDDSGRLFVAEQGGRIHILEDGQRQLRPFLDVSSLLVSGGAAGERGLLGLAFHPQYAIAGSAGEGKFYLHYSAPSFFGDHDSVIAEFRVSATDPDVADFFSRRTILRFTQPFSNHNGGDLKFGPDDGLLYISSGDGGSVGDPLGNGQNPATLLGAILRIDVNGDDFPQDNSRNYAIPPSNPFVGDPAGRDEIFAIGLRNPYRMSFDDGDEGLASEDRLFVGDVGQTTFEEVDIVTVGGNYGWNVCEGDHRFNNANQACPPQFDPPIAEYGRDQGIAVIGGFVYRGSQFPDLSGVYLFGDFNGTLMALEQQSDGTFVRTVPTVNGDPGFGILGFGQDQAGELYVLTLTQIFSIRSDQQPDSDFGDAPTAAQSGLANSYPTRLPSGARHTVSSALRLGASVDIDGNGQPTAAADGDGSDEDGVVNLATIVATSSTVTTSSVNVTASAAGRLDAWVDFNRDGDWNDVGEQIFMSRQLVAGSNLLRFSVPAGADSGATYARFRLSSQGGLAPTGPADDGEVEDYQWTILDGDAGGAVASVDVPVAGSVQIALQNNQLVVTAAVELFRSPIAALASLRLSLSPGNDVVSLPNFGAVPVAFEIDGRGGTDLLRLVGSGHQLDLTQLPDGSLRNLEMLDVKGDGANTLRLNVSEVIGLSDTTDTLRVIHDPDDSIDYGTGWIVEEPQFISDAFVSNQFVHLARQQTAVLQIINPLPYQNPLELTDVNRDGHPTGRDALQIINALAARQGPLQLPPMPPRPHLYVDVTGENVLTALDALRVINELARRSLGQGQSAERETIVSRQESPVLPWLAAARQVDRVFSAVASDSQETVWPVPDAAAGPSNHSDSSRRISTSLVTPDADPHKRAARTDAALTDLLGTSLAAAIRGDSDLGGP